MHKKLVKIILVFIFLITNCGISMVYPQTVLIYEDKIYQPDIETVVFYRTGKINTYPLLAFEDPTQSLTLAFDDMQGGYRSFSYRIIHCDYNWKPSNLYPEEYLEGQEYDDITKYEFSNNTYRAYTNYHVNIPSENMSFKMSGNYLLKVYESGDEEKLVLTRRFYVAASLVNITASVNRPSYAKYRKYKQELDFEVNYDKMNVMNPLVDFNVVIRQNQRWDNQIKDLPPMYVNGNNLIYDFETENIFDGLSEWRYSDLRPLKYPGFGVNKIELDTIYNMYLLTEEDRSYLAYAEWNDINGNRVIAGENKDLNMNEIDYVSTHFRLTTPYPKDEEVYLFGALTDWKIQDRYKMTYDASKNAYTADILLKQGYYNYYYVTYDIDSNHIDCIRFQGDHFETENDYLVLVYLKSRFFDTHELVGYSILNSRKE